MLNRIWILFLLLISINIHYAQKDSVYYGESESKQKESPKPKKNYDFKKKLIYGGNFSLLFGSYTLINLSPTVGYKITEKLQAGVGIIYYYSSVIYRKTRYSQSLYGTHVFGRYFINSNLFAQVQYDRLNQNNYLLSNYTKEKIWVDYVMIGGGYRQPLGDRAALMVSVMYNLTPSPLSVYYNPYFQMGIIAGF